ncbi:MAG: MFS transporter [Porticoccaceae bacterium]
MNNITPPTRPTAGIDWLASLSIYLDVRMPKILLLGSISGFPWVLIGSMITLWLKDTGFSRSNIGLFGVIFTVYALNMLWAPVVDNLRIPLLSKWVGLRKSWILLMQVIIMIGICALSTLTPAEHIKWIAGWAFIIALASATQDISIDATRIELIGELEVSKIGAGSAMATSGWWIGYGFGGGAALYCANLLQQQGLANYWQTTYLLSLIYIAISILLLLLFVREPCHQNRAQHQSSDTEAMAALLFRQATRNESEKHTRRLIAGIVLSGLFFSFAGFEALQALLTQHLGTDNGLVQFLALWVAFMLVAALFVAAITQFRPKTSPASLPSQALPSHTLPFRIEAGSARHKFAHVLAIYYMPVARFLQQHGSRVGLLLLAVIFFFKIGEAFLGRMSLVFYQEIGFDKQDIAIYSKALGTLTVCVFAVIGSVINAHYGLFRGLVLSAIAMAATNLLFAALAWWPEKWLFTIAVVGDQFTAAISTVAFVAFISQLCDRSYTASQYAAFASIGNFARTSLAASSGMLVDGLNGNWPVFFVLTAVMVIPSLILLFWLRKDIAPILAGKSFR